MSRVYIKRLLESNLSFGVISHSVVAQGHSIPDIGGRFGIFSNNLLEMTQTLFVVSFIKLNNCFSHQAKGLQSTLNQFIAIRAISELRLTALTVAEGLLKLPNGYFVETH
jgi:hypothetical protein